MLCTSLQSTVVRSRLYRYGKSIPGNFSTARLQLLRPDFKNHKTSSALGIAGAILLTGLFTYNSKCTELEGVQNGNENSIKLDGAPTPPLFTLDGESEFSTIVVGGGTAGCTVAYFTAKWMLDNNIPGTVLLLDRGVDFFSKKGPDPKMSAWFENWGIYGEAHPSLREDGTAYPVTVRNSVFVLSFCQTLVE
jgi:hypothetical protein